jgi:glyoxylase I family protein
MPELIGISHVALSVRDREASAAWYCDVLGFSPLEELHEEAFDESILVHRPTGTVLCLQQHKANRGEEFDPARTGGDHLGLRVEHREELDKWAAWFDEKGVVRSPVVDRDYGAVLCFKDPDRFQLELFYRVDHP